MYQITERYDGDWACEVEVQDGVERWVEETKDRAIGAVVSAAWTLNGARIRRDEVTVVPFAIASGPGDKSVTASNAQLLRNITSGHLVVLEATDPRIAYRLSDDELDNIIAIREGRLTLTPSEDK
jgi:hypothetical protein